MAFVSCRAKEAFSSSSYYLRTYQILSDHLSSTLDLSHISKLALMRDSQSHFNNYYESHFMSTFCITAYTS